MLARIYGNYCGCSAGTFVACGQNVNVGQSYDATLVPHCKVTIIK